MAMKMRSLLVEVTSMMMAQGMMIVDTTLFRLELFVGNKLIVSKINWSDQ